MNTRELIELAIENIRDHHFSAYRDIYLPMPETLEDACAVLLRVRSRMAEVEKERDELKKELEIQMELETGGCPNCEDYARGMKLHRESLDKFFGKDKGPGEQ